MGIFCRRARNASRDKHAAPRRRYAISFASCRTLAGLPLPAIVWRDDGRDRQRGRNALRVCTRPAKIVDPLPHRLCDWIMQPPDSPNALRFLVRENAWTIAGTCCGARSLDRRFFRKAVWIRRLRGRFQKCCNTGPSSPRVSSIRTMPTYSISLDTYVQDKCLNSRRWFALPAAVLSVPDLSCEDTQQACSYGEGFYEWLRFHSCPAINAMLMQHQVYTSYSTLIDRKAKKKSKRPSPMLLEFLFLKGKSDHRRAWRFSISERSFPHSERFLFLLRVPRNSLRRRSQRPYFSVFSV